MLCEVANMGGEKWRITKKYHSKINSNIRPVKLHILVFDVKKQLHHQKKEYQKKETHIFVFMSNVLNLNMELSCEQFHTT